MYSSVGAVCYELSSLISIAQMTDASRCHGLHSNRLIFIHIWSCSVYFSGRYQLLHYPVWWNFLPSWSCLSLSPKTPKAFSNILRLRFTVIGISCFHVFLQIKIATKPGWQNIVRGQVYVLSDLSLNKGKCNNLSEVVFFVLQIITVDEACSFIHDCSAKWVSSVKKKRKQTSLNSGFYLWRANSVCSSKQT